jgi:hypothetical protein
MTDPNVVTGLTNQEFFERYARPGRIGLVGGAELANRAIARAQRHLNADKTWSHWSHAFLFQGRRADGHHWIIESDLDIQRKIIRLGVQENRIAKYGDDADYPVVGVIDLGLTTEQEQAALAQALELVSAGTRYSLREIVGTVWALRHPKWQPQENLLGQEKAFYCSAFVRHTLGRVGVNLAPDVAEKNTTPEHLWQMTVPHTKWLLTRERKPSALRQAVRRVKAKFRKK